MKIQLIMAQHTNSGRTTHPALPPIGLEILAASLEHRCLLEARSVSIEILDGSVMDRQTIINALDADWVGFSDVFSNHCESLLLAEQAKHCGAKVIFGGPNATHLAERILSNHKFIDFVIAGDGENAFPDLVLGKELSSIPNLYFRNGSSVQHNASVNVDINTVPFFTLDHIQNLEAFSIETEPMPICSIRGCAKAVIEGRCDYCSIPNQKLRLQTPERFWQQIKILNDRYGAISFFEAGDSFLVEYSGDRSKRKSMYPEKLLIAKPAEVDIAIRIYERAETITSETVYLLKKLGVKEVFVGFEHVDETIRRRSNRPSRQPDIWAALDALAECNITVTLAIMFGLPGETEITAKRNYDFILETAARYSNISTYFISLAMPLYGTHLFQTLIKDRAVCREYNRHGYDILHDDSFDYGLLMRLMMRQQMSIKPKSLSQLVNNLRQNLGITQVTGFGVEHLTLQENDEV